MRRKLATILILLGVLVLLAGCVQPNSPPTARFTRSPSSGDAPLFVSFDASSSSDNDGFIVSYSWAFGDGSSGTGVTASHTYGEAGNYSATLTVRDDDGATDSKTLTVAVSGESTPVLPTPSVDYRATVGQIIDEFDANEVAAEIKYEGKLIAISGYIRDFGTYINDDPIVLLNRHLGGSVFDDEVLCYFPYEDRGSVALLSKGDYVTIVGEYWMYGLGNVYIHYCYLP